MQYQEYLLSDHWQKLRGEAFARAHHRCEACRYNTDKTILHGHHLRYRTPLTLCVPEDIMAICSECHDEFHRWIDALKKRSCDYSRQETINMARSLRGFPAMGKKFPKIKVQSKKTSEHDLHERIGRHNATVFFSYLKETQNWNHAVTKLMSTTGKNFRFLYRGKQRVSQNGREPNRAPTPRQMMRTAIHY